MSSPHHWRDVLIAHSEAITDAWEVAKAYAARLAEWVLFGCMVANILEILPDIHLPSAVSSAVLGVQAITLDIAGFGLAINGRLRETLWQHVSRSESKHHRLLSHRHHADHTADCEHWRPLACIKRYRGAG